MPRIHRSALVAIIVLALGLPAATIRAQIPGGLNVQLTATPSTQQVGVAVSFDYSATPPAVAPPFASITNVKVDYGDGQYISGDSGAAGQKVTGTVSHAYTSAGVYTATITADASNGGHGSTTATVTIQGGSTPRPGAGLNVPFPVGWNLIAAPSGTTIPGPGSAVYTYQAGDTAYQVVQNLQTGFGYWDYFDSPTTATIPSGSPQTVTRQLPAGQYIMIGNPGAFPATVRGADVVYVYNPSSGYQQTTTLQPGQGAWALSLNGGTATISN